MKSAIRRKNGLKADVRRSRQLSHAGSFFRFVPTPEVEGAEGSAEEVEATGGASEDMVGEVGGGGESV
jgi:hypothetical protein